MADRRKLGRLPAGVARRRADAGAERHRSPGDCDRPSPERHSADPDHRCRDQHLYIDGPVARDRPADVARALCRRGNPWAARGGRRGGPMMRLRINGAEAEVAVATIAELLAEQGIDPKARFLAVAVNGAVVRPAEWPAAALAAGDTVEIVRPFQGG